MSKKVVRNRQPIPSRPTPATTPAQPSLPQMVLGYNPSGPIEQMDVETSKTAWSEFTLNDGTIVRVKGVVIDVKKAKDQYAADGKPIYLLQMTLVNDLVVPQGLMKVKD